MPIVDAKNLKKSLGSRTLFEGADLTILRGEKVGLVGDNGAGKSTLAKILAKTTDFDAGSLNSRKGARVEYLEQEPVFQTDRTALQAVLDCAGDWQTLRKRFDTVSAKLAEGGMPLEPLL
ncbi:MAG: ATP-binding cassette domain-containing protein, partial [Polyangiaceae bacterium]|nr:ATP-binding cassette domain-containing protein [Polyangiaceae bacterium]